MANKHRASNNNQTAPKAGRNFIFIIAVCVLVALLLVMFIRNRSRRAEFLKLQEQAAVSEEYQVLEPKIDEEETEDSEESDEFVNEATQN